MKKWIYLSIILAVVSALFIPQMPGFTQPLIPEETQIVEFLQAHQLLASPDVKVLAVRVERNALVIDLSVEVLPEGNYEADIFNTLQEDLDREFAINTLFMTTFLVEGQPLSFWGEPQPDFSILADSGRIQTVPGTGPLAGVKVALSPGHGWYYSDIYNDWRWQRLEFWGIREDLVNAEIMRYVKSGLEFQGATVIQLRELNFYAGYGVSTLPSWQEATRHFAIAEGLPAWIYNGGSNNYNSDIRARPYMANYYGADILISLHNNGWNGTLRGTETYWDINNHPGSQSLANAVHNRVIHTLRTEVDPGWTNRGVKSSDWSYGEIYYAQMPAILLELAFMDNIQDNNYLQQNWFKYLAARAIVDGICDYQGVTCRSIIGMNPVYLPLIIQ